MTSVTALRGEYPLELLLRVSGMSRSTYYHRAWSLRRRESGRPEDALIAEAFAGSGGEYGCRKVAAALERRGVHMNFKTVNRRMRSMGLVCTYRRKRRRRSGGAAGHAPNLLGRKFGASAPLEKLVTDVTEMRVLGGRRLYLSSIMDLHNNMVLAHSVSRSNSWEMVGEMLGRLERRWGVPRGGSMSGRGSCYDNAVIESHFGNLKGRLGRLDGVPEDKAAEMIDEAVRYFNEERILLKLGGLSPAEFLREYEKRQERGRKAAANI